MQKSTRAYTMDLLWAQLKALPFGTWTTAEELAKRSKEIQADDDGTYVITKFGEAISANELEEAGQNLWEIAED